jgi:hypothetical protein
MTFRHAAKAPRDELRQSVEAENHLVQSLGSLRHALLATFCIGGIAWYLFKGMGFGLCELLHCVAGATALWAPIGWLVFLLLHDQFSDILSRLTFSAVASYALTTLLYFGFCVAGLWLPGCENGFYVVEAGLLITAFAWAWRHGLRQGLRQLRKISNDFDWTLASLLVASLLICLRYQKAFEWQPVYGRYLLVTNGDQAYFAAIAHELARHTPPLQQPTRAGVPDRAYHLFPHLTSMLLARYTGQLDMLRANLVYQYAILTIVMALVLFSIVRLLTGSRGAGYITVALMYIGAVPLPPLDPTHREIFFYFNLWPHATSTLEPVLITSPQMYYGIVVYYGILLGLAVACQRVMRGQPVGGLVVVTALLIGALARFRIQIFLPLLPGFLLLVSWFWRKTRQPVFPVAGCLALAVAAGLLLETRLGIYLAHTSHLTVGNSRLPWKFTFISSWPGALWVQEKLAGALAPSGHTYTLDWIWQILCVSMFVLANIIGVPLLVGCVGYFLERGAWREWRPLSLFSLCLVLSSLAGAVCLRATYDPWSVGGQMVLHTSWYIFPLAGAGLWALFQRFPAGWRQATSVWQPVGVALVLGFGIWQLERGPSRLQQDQRKKQIAVSADEWAALKYIWQALPTESVILSPNYHANGTAFFSGVGGRRTYLEYIPTPMGLRMWTDEADSDRERSQCISRLWNAATEEAFCQALPAGVTHLVEYRWQPLPVHPASMLRSVWVSPRRAVTIWEVIR